MPTPEYPNPAWFDLPESERVIYLSPEEADRLEAVLDEEPRVIPELAAAIRKVREQFPAFAVDRTRSDDEGPDTAG
ncbi:hypothetical protein [Luteimicrobium album]|nr:hypothetical protein [Luteimicrobium album]